MRLLRTLGSCSVIAQCRSLASLREMARKVEPSELYEPKIVDRRAYPEAGVLNVRLQGYDYVPIEKFQGFVYKIAKRFNFTVIESYGVAARVDRVQIYRPNSTIVVSELELQTFDRVVRLGDVPSVRVQLFMSLLRAHLPIGVKMTVKKLDREDEEYRYIPDLLLKQKQDELKSLDDPNVRRNLGWE